MDMTFREWLCSPIPETQAAPLKKKKKSLDQEWFCFVLHDSKHGRTTKPQSAEAHGIDVG